MAGHGATYAKDFKVSYNKDFFRNRDVTAQMKMDLKVKVKEIRFEF